MTLRTNFLIGIALFVGFLFITGGLWFNFDTLFVNTEKEKAIQEEVLKADIRFLDQRNVTIFNSKNAAQVKKYITELETLGFVIKEGSLVVSSDENDFILRLLIIKDNQEYLYRVEKQTLAFSNTPRVFITTEKINQGESL